MLLDIAELFIVNNGYEVLTVVFVQSKGSLFVLFRNLKYMSRCVLEPPMLPADLFVPSPGYEVPPDLATVPRPLVYTFCGLRCLQHQFECSE